MILPEGAALEFHIASVWPGSRLHLLKLCCLGFAICAMAMHISVELISGKKCTLEVPPDTTIRELKEKLKAFHPSEDQLTRKLSSVEIVLGSEKLSELDRPISACIREGATVQVLFLQQAIECKSFRAARRSGLTEIDELIDVRIPDGANGIQEFAFHGCRNLLRVEIPSSVTRIGTCSFQGCSSLTSLTIPSSVTRLDFNAFAECSCLRTLTIPSSVSRLGVGAFRGCSSLASVTIPSSMTRIESFTFTNCRALTSLSIPDSVTEIGQGAFQNCSSLTSLAIPNSVSLIGAWAFAGCSALTSLTIPDSVSRIGRGAFDACSSLCPEHLAKTLPAIPSKKRKNSE